MNEDIRQYVQSCVVCQKHHSLKKMEELHPLKSDYPNEIVGMDIFQFPNDTSQFIVFCDYFSKWIEVARLKDTTSKSIFNAFEKKWLKRHGIPATVRSDGAHNLASEEPLLS
eukprot:TRINITY_DN889_c0_g2_i35.p2 TRINITY_DN889_c0_g2~~TRINITY_DN889_c0_g2_i35.p2  ORF type:complete len:112 (-),score=12.89 TRINITY_DN889_c0_g2_i35:476-811(-)